MHIPYWKDSTEANVLKIEGIFILPQKWIGFMITILDHVKYDFFKAIED